MSFGKDYITHLSAVSAELEALRNQLEDDTSQQSPEELLQEITNHMNRFVFTDCPQSRAAIQTHLENMFYAHKPVLRGNRTAFCHFLQDQVVDLRFRRFARQHFICAYSATFREGYCTALPMLVLEKMNNRLPFWPENPEVLADPMKLVQHFQKHAPQLVFATSPIVPLTTLLTHLSPEPGLLVVLDMAQRQGTPSTKSGEKHLVIYRGRQERTHQFEFISFDHDDQHVVLKNHQCGYVINLPALFPKAEPRTAHRLPFERRDFAKQRT